MNSIPQRAYTVARSFVPPILIPAIKRLVGRSDQVSVATQKLAERPLAQLVPGSRLPNIVVPASQIERRWDMVLPLPELLTIGAVCQALRPRRVLEIGTYTGSTTLLIALNTPPETEIFTLDLHPDKRKEYGSARGIELEDFEVGREFVNSPMAGKVTQLYGDSRSFDFSPYRDSMDLIFIDADHSYDCVKADTEAAMSVLSQDGVIIWDDYTSYKQFLGCEGVLEFLNELVNTQPCAQVQGTRLAMSTPAIRHSR